jgi:hypothetical protein
VKVAISVLKTIFGIYIEDDNSLCFIMSSTMINYFNYNKMAPMKFILTNIFKSFQVHRDFLLEFSDESIFFIWK